MMFELLLEVVDRFLNFRDTNAEFAIARVDKQSFESMRTLATRSYPYPTGRFGQGTLPGTSCQATIAPSLRDISQQAGGPW
jgi:hypothetical protein